MKTSLKGVMLAIICLTAFSCSPKNNEQDVESQELYRIQVGGKYGFINEKGKLIIDPQFNDVNFYFGDGICYAVLGEKKGLINTAGEFVVELDSTFGGVGYFSKGLALFYTTKGLWGIVNTSGEAFLPAIYKNIYRDRNNGYIIEDTLGRHGYINCHGDIVVPCKYNDALGFTEGLMVVATGSKYGYVDTLGNWVIDTMYDDARIFGNGVARVKIGNQWHFIDHNGDLVFELLFDDILTGFTCNRAFVKKDGKIEMINRKGQKIAEINADTMYGFNEGYATFQKNGKYGKLDTTGVIVVQPKFEKLHNTIKGVSVFEKNGKYGVIDTVGNVIVDPLYEHIMNNDDFSLLVCGNENWEKVVYYDRKGNLIWKDQGNTFIWPEKPSKSDYVAYFDSRLSELDPIEGVYYVTFNRMAVDRENDHASSNGSKSYFYAVIRTPNTDEFIAYDIDDPGKLWVKKFVQIGESNAYAVVNAGESTWAEDGKLILEDPYKFEVTLRMGGNNWYNWYAQCEFIKDYPSATEYEQVQLAEWSGTGFAIADGYLVTNYHVINGAKTITIKGVNGKMKESYKGYVVASDREHDLAIIKIVDKKYNGFDDIPYCIGNNVPEVGDDIFVLGYPMINTMGKDIKLTNGIISASSGFKGDQSMYQISAAVQPGNSGGPLFDNEGNVIGIINAKHADAENANYAIKVSYLFSLINGSDLGIKMPDNNKIKSKSLSKKVKLVKPFVYLIECSSH